MYRSHSNRGGFTLVELLVVISIIGVLMSLLLPAVNSARESGRRTQCLNNLKNLGLGAQQHLEKNRRYPTGGWGPTWIGVADGGTGANQPGGWVYNLLPYLENIALHDATTGAAATMNAQTAKQAATVLAIVNCPSRRGAQLYPASDTYRPVDPSSTSGQQVDPNNGTIQKQTCKSDYAANAGVGYQTASTQSATGPTPRADTTNGDAGCFLVPATDGVYYPKIFKDSTGKYGTQSNNSYSWSGVIYQKSTLSDASVKDGPSKTYMFGEKFVDRKHYEDGLAPGDQGNAYSGMGVDNYRTTYVEPASTSSTTTGIEPDDPGQPTSNQSKLPSLLNDQVDPPSSLNVTTPFYYCKFGSAHSGVVNFAFCDGHTTGVSVSIDPLTHRYLGERNDGKILDDSVIGN